MKKAITSILLISLISCKNSDTPVADLATGTYQMTSEISYRSNGLITKQTASGKLSISRVNGETFEFTEDYGGYYRKYQAQIQGQRISVVSGSTESLRIGNLDYMGFLSGKGVIETDGKSINFDTVSEVNQPGITFTKSAFVTGSR